MYNIWLFPKWYPNREDPQLGVFIQKHARTIAVKHKVTVLYIHSVSGLNRKYEIVRQTTDQVEEVFVYFKKSSGIFSRLTNIFRYWKSLKTGLKTLKTISPSPDVLHAYILLRPAFIAWYLSGKMKIPFVISEQWSGYVTGKFSSGSFFRKLISRRIFRKASVVTSVSRFLLKGMNENGLINENTFITPNCIEMNAVTPNIRREKIYVLMVADLVDEIKNISGVLRMISTLEEENFELHIIGHGRDEKKLKELAGQLGISDKVFFEGLKTNSQVYEYLRQCNFLVMNSRFETFSLICAEALSCGKPVIATRCGGPDEFITEQTGYLIEPDNESELRSAFVRMINSFETFESPKLAAYSAGLFSPKVVAQEFDRVFRKACQKP